jgi:hypothetical protein
LVAVSVVVPLPDKVTFQLLFIVVGSAKFSFSVQPLGVVVPLLVTDTSIWYDAACSALTAAVQAMPPEPVLEDELLDEDELLELEELLLEDDELELEDELFDDELLELLELLDEELEPLEVPPGSCPQTRVSPSYRAILGASCAVLP